jgi:hypothetical protein
MRILNTLKILAAGSVLALLAACGGAGAAPGAIPPPSSKGLAYTDPKGGDWSLVRNAASTGTHLVLDLVGPATGKFRGVGFNLLSDGNAAFAKLSDAGYVATTGVFKLQSTYANYAVEPVAMAGGVKQDGKLLTVGVFQKDRYWPAVAVNKPVLQIAIDFDAVKTAALPPGTAIPLTITKAKAIPSYIGDAPADPTDLNQWISAAVYYNQSIVPVQVAVGTLVTQ